MAYFFLFNQLNMLILHLNCLLCEMMDLAETYRNKFTHSSTCIQILDVYNLKIKIKTIKVGEIVYEAGRMCCTNVAVAVGSI